MHYRLETIWRRLNCRIVNKFGRDRRVINSSGKTICEGGLQAELNYLQINHPSYMGASRN